MMGYKKPMMKSEGGMAKSKKMDDMPKSAKKGKKDMMASSGGSVRSNGCATKGKKSVKIY